MAFATYTLPIAPGCTVHDDTAVGAGGGGGGGFGGEAGGGGGGGGGTIRATFTVVPGETLTLHIGIAGAGGPSQFNPQNGGTGGPTEVIPQALPAAIQGLGAAGGNGGVLGGNGGAGGTVNNGTVIAIISSNNGSPGIIGGPVNPALGGTGAAAPGGTGGPAGAPAVSTGGRGGGRWFGGRRAGKWCGCGGRWRRCWWHRERYLWRWGKRDRRRSNHPLYRDFGLFRVYDFAGPYEPVLLSARSNTHVRTKLLCESQACSAGHVG